MTPLDRLFKLLSSLESKNIPIRLDKHGADEITVAFVLDDRLVEAAYDADGMWFSHFQKDTRVINDRTLMAILAERWRDEPGATTSSSPSWSKIGDPLARFLAFLAMLDEKKITWRLDASTADLISVFFTVIDARVIAEMGKGGLTFTVYNGSEDVFPETDLPALFPGLRLVAG